MRTITVTETTTLYTLKELKELSEQKLVPHGTLDAARKGVSSIAYYDDWYEYTIEMWQTALEQLGFTDAKIDFVLSYSQGDGASFTSDIDLAVLAKWLSAPIKASDHIGVNADGTEAFVPWLARQVNFPCDKKYRHLVNLTDYLRSNKVVRTSNRYFHQNTCSVELELDLKGEHSTLDDSGKTEFIWTPHQPKVEATFNEFITDVEDLRRALCVAIYAALEEEHEHLTSDKHQEELAEEYNYEFDRFGTLFEDAPESDETDEEPQLRKPGNLCSTLNKFRIT